MSDYRIVPEYPDYRVSSNGVVIDARGRTVRMNYNRITRRYYVTLNDQVLDVATLVYNTFVGDVPNF